MFGEDCAAIKADWTGTAEIKQDVSPLLLLSGVRCYTIGLVLVINVVVFFSSSLQPLQWGTADAEFKGQLLPFRSIHLHFFPPSPPPTPDFFLCWLWLTPVLFEPVE